MITQLYFTQTKSNTFKPTPMLSDWKYRSEPGKAGLLTFRSPEYFEGGVHVKLVKNSKPIFGGQVVRSVSKKNDFYNYEALDYKQYLLKEVSINKKNITATSIVKLLSKKISTLKWKIGKTKKKYSHLVFEDKTVLSIINQLIWLEYKKAKNLIFFNVDYDANLTFKNYPTKMNGYIFKEAFDYESSLDYSDIRTGYELIDKDTGKVIYKSSDKTLQAIWGDIRIQGVFDDGD
ncbi:MAG: hypothetical protein LBU40_00240 [Methanobrevibacter sp.]|nr:hypothetical protein [Methanobrevibacter sp.]